MLGGEPPASAHSPALYHKDVVLFYPRHTLAIVGVGTHCLTQWVSDRAAYFGGIFGDLPSKVPALGHKKITRNTL